MVLLLGSLARGLKPGVVGTESLPPDDRAYKAQRLLESELGFPRYQPTWAIATGVHSPKEAAQIERRLVDAAGGQRVRGVIDVPPEQAPLYLRDGYAVFELQQLAGDNDDATHRWLDRIRATRWPSDTRVLLSGEAAAYQDFLQVLTSDFPVVFGTVLTLTLGLLGVAFRSIALPIKAVSMNLLSVAAAIGVLTWGVIRLLLVPAMMRVLGDLNWPGSKVRGRHVVHGELEEQSGVLE